MTKLTANLSLAATLAGIATIFGATSAQAFDFKTNYTGEAPKGDIWLQSVEFGGDVYTEFSLVNDAKIVSNDLWTTGNEGAASADKGDNATTGVKVEKATAASLITNLNNTNLNNIVDTEDKGSFAIDLFFDKAVDNVLLWERGQNSALGLQAIDANGNLLGNNVVVDFRQLDKNLYYAGYSIDTQEIGGAQKVNSYGISLAEFAVGGPIVGVRATSLGSQYNGPDWKVMGTTAPDAVGTPEPFSMIGSALALGGAAILKRRKQK
jgi:hypothetical protein